MKSNINTEVWNAQMVMLMQAMLGAISSNFRMVTIEYEDDMWILRFYIEKEDPIDFEEIDDIGIEFSALHMDDFRFKQETIVTEDPIDWPMLPARVVFKRREL